MQGKGFFVEVSLATVTSGLSNIPGMVVAISSECYRVP